MMDYFNQLFTASDIDGERVTNCMNTKVTQEQNAMLLAEVSEEEVKTALFNMHPDKSPDPDGMSRGFIKNAGKF